MSIKIHKGPVVELRVSAIVEPRPSRGGSRAPQRRNGKGSATEGGPDLERGAELEALARSPVVQSCISRRSFRSVFGREGEPRLGSIRENERGA